MPRRKPLVEKSELTINDNAYLYFYLQRVRLDFLALRIAFGAKVKNANSNAKETHDMGRTYELYGTIKSEVANIMPGNKKATARCLIFLFIVLCI